MIRKLQKLYLSALFVLGVGLSAFFATVLVRGIVHPSVPWKSVAASSHAPEFIAQNSVITPSPRASRSPFGTLDRESMFKPTPELVALAAQFPGPPARDAEPKVARQDKLEPAPAGIDITAISDAALRDNGDGPPRATFTTASRDALGASREQDGSLRILQIGDSHTAADLFTGEIRKELQARYGDGGVGYVDIGQPHPGVRSAVLKTSVSDGWTYNALQKSGDASRFYLSGFDAETSRSGERLVFTSPQPIPYNVIEIEFVASPASGSVDISFDDLPPIHRSLVSSKRDRIVERLLPDGSGPRQISKLSITTTENKPVIVASVSIVNTTYGVSYSNVGFPGATIDIINKFDPRLFGHELQRINPQIVVLAFGTNEGFNDNLDLAAYREGYLNVVGMIRKNLPMARVVIVGPADGNRVPGPCIKDPMSGRCGAARRVEAGDEGACPWPTPPKLRGVRDVQRRIAEDESIPFWDWAGIMASKCGAHAWFTTNPRLMAADHVHFTAEGYKTSARAFAEFLMPLVSPLRRENYALSHH
jgi:lysophospholipase L1-like esterase